VKFSGIEKKEKLNERPPGGKESKPSLIRDELADCCVRGGDGWPLRVGFSSRQSSARKSLGKLREGWGNRCSFKGLRKTGAYCMSHLSAEILKELV